MKLIRCQLGSEKITLGNFVFAMSFLIHQDNVSANRAPPMALQTLLAAGDMGEGNFLHRTEVMQKLELDSTRILRSSLVHGTEVNFIESKAQVLPAKAGLLPTCDGLLCSDTKYLPSVTVGDCLPIWIWDITTGIFGVLHSGWRGTGIVIKAIDVLLQRGGCIEGISIILGPCIGSCCYLVEEKRAKIFSASFGTESVVQRPQGMALDIRAANLSLLQNKGIQSILSVENCTCCDLRFGSFRRQFKNDNTFTKMLALCGYCKPRLLV